MMKSTRTEVTDNVSSANWVSIETETFLLSIITCVRWQLPVIEKPNGCLCNRNDPEWDKNRYIDNIFPSALMLQERLCRNLPGGRNNLTIITENKIALYWTAVGLGFGMTSVATLTTFTGSVKAVSPLIFFYPSILYFP